MDLDLAQAGQRMEPPCFCGNQMHVFYEDRDNWHTGFLCNEINPRLAGRDMNAIAAGSFRKDD